MSKLNLADAETFVRRWEATRIELHDALRHAERSRSTLHRATVNDTIVITDHAAQTYLGLLRMALEEAEAKTKHYKNEAGRLFAEQQAAGDAP